MEPHVSKYKENVVKSLVKLAKEYPIVGAVDMENMPASSLQSMRAQLREKVVLRMAKRRLIHYVIDAVKNEKKDIEKLEPYLKGMPALLFTKENPFALFRTISKNKSPAPAKAGQTAPKDIVIPAGPTPFAPGPVIGELGAAGLKTEVKEGKIHIKEDAVVAKEGEEIKANIAGLLTRLGIEPMEIGLDITAVYEDGVIYDKKVLAIDEDAFLQSLQDAARWAFNLAVEAGHYTPETVELLIPKAFREAKAVALEANILADAVVEELLGKAERQGLALKETANIEVGAAKPMKEEPKQKEEKKEEPKEEVLQEQPAEEPPKEEPKVEEKQEEPKVEKKKEEPKEEEKPAEETPKEEPDVEEKKEVEEPTPKEESKVEEKSAEEAPKSEKTKGPEPKETSEEEPKDPSTRDQETQPVVAPSYEIEEKKEELPAKVEEAAELPSTENVITEAIKKNEEAKIEKEAGQAVEKPTKEKIIEEETEIVEDLSHVKEEIAEERKHPKLEEIKKIAEEVEEVEEKIENVDKEKQELPTDKKIIIEEKKIDEEKKKMTAEGEKLFETLKQKGTLRGIEESPKPIEPKTPEEIIEEAQKKKKK